MKNPYILYGQDLSFFTQKVKDYLRYKAVPFEYRIASQEIMDNLIVPRTGVKYMPVLLLPDNRIIQDTSCIIDHIESEFSQPNIKTKSPILRLIGTFAELFSDEWMIIPAIHYRWNFKKENHEYVIKAFGRALAPKLPSEKQYKIGRLYARFFSGARLPLGICQETIPMIEHETERLLKFLHEHFSMHDFMLGREPTLADFSLMGCLSAHLGLDPYPTLLLAKKYPGILEWIKKMRHKKFSGDDLFVESALPESLLEIIRFMLDAMESYLSNTIPFLQKELSENIEQYKLDIPRNLGDITFKLGDVSVQRKATIFTQWMLQRFLTELDKVSTKKRDEFFKIMRRKDYFNFDLSIKVEHKCVLNEGETLPTGSTLTAVLV